MKVSFLVLPFCSFTMTTANDISEVPSAPACALLSAQMGPRSYCREVSYFIPRSSWTKFSCSSLQVSTHQLERLFCKCIRYKHLHSCCPFKRDDLGGYSFILIVLKTENTFGSSLGTESRALYSSLTLNWTIIERQTSSCQALGCDDQKVSLPQEHCI